MTRNYTWLIVFAASLLLLISCNNNTEITEQNVARIIKKLSADSLKGRHTFTPEIRKAANIIASEFESIGLSPLPGEQNFHQSFNVFTIRPDSVSVVINGEALEENDYFGILNTDSLIWTMDKVAVMQISNEHDFRERFRSLTSDDLSSLIVVDKAHNKWFHRYRSYFMGRNRTFELNSSPSDIFILYPSPVNSFNLVFKNKVVSTELSNVAGMIEGKRNDEIVLFSAHYDHIGVVAPVGRDSIANGANDNASGVAGVIEIARYYQNIKPERTLYFVGFTAEEAGGYGSKYLSQQVNPDHIVAMFNLEMIGKPALEGTNYAWITGFEYSSFGEILQSSVEDSNFVFFPDPYPGQNLFFRSDNATFARLGVPAHTISTTPIDVDRDYHHVSDEFQTIEVPHTANTIKAIAKAAAPVISGDKTPTRIHPDSLQSHN